MGAIFGGIVNFFAGPLGKWAMIAALIGGFFWWKAAHDAGLKGKFKQEGRIEMSRELDEVKKEEWKTREDAIAQHEKEATAKLEQLDLALQSLDASTAKVKNEALRLKATNQARLGAIPASVAAIPDPQLELMYREALKELRDQETP